MAFQIEVAGEAAPLTPQQILLALKSAGSSEQQSIRTGTQQLQTWESREGYYALLQAAYLDKSLPSEIRYLAIIQLKNGIDKYWRKSATNAINAREKAEIRSRLLEGGVGEAENLLALQNALVISKVVRIDYPNEWPDIITSLIKILREATRSNQLHLRRGMLILLQIVKELATARLRASQTRLISVTPELVFLLSEIYLEKINLWTSFLNGQGEDEGGAMDAMENSLFAIKILRRLLIVGYEYPNHAKDVQQLWEHSQHQFAQFLEILSHDPPVLVSPAKDLVEKHLVQLSKLHVQMANQHPAAFALLPSSLDLVRAYWGLVSRYADSYGSESQDFSTKALKVDENSKDERPVMEKLCLKGLNVLRACIKMVFSPVQSFKYRSPEVKAEQIEAIEFLKSQLLTDEMVGHMASVIVTKFFVFRQVDLEAWEEDEDEWELREEGGGDTWEFEVRPCSEKLFMDLVLNFKHLLTDPLLSFFQSVASTTQANVVTKDAVYTAMGLSAPVIFKNFDFDTFLTSTLINDIQQTGAGYKVLRRRIAILVGQWITVRVSEENRPLVYQIFQHLLKSEDATNDHVVRITAARQFKAVVDDFGFDAEKFLPYAPDILNRVMALIQEVEQTETRMAILETIRAIATRLEQHVTPFADQIVTLLPGLWEASGEEHLLKQAILTLLSTLVIAMGTQSSRYHPLILPLIANAVAPGSEMQVYLLEEALELWANILSQTATPAPEAILSLIESIFPLLELGSDNLRNVLSILESYVLLAPSHLLSNTFRLRTLSYMNSLLGVTKRELAGIVTTTIEALVQHAEALGGVQGITQVAKDLHESGLLDQIFSGLRDAWEAHQTSGPNRRYPKLDDVVETDYFTILARLAMADPVVFVEILKSLGDLDESWNWLSTEWFRHFDSMANVERQKISCLALTRMLELPPPLAPLILAKLQDYFFMWTHVIAELLGGGENNSDCLVWGSVDYTGYRGETEEAKRKREWMGKDPVYSVETLAFVKQRLGMAMNSAGGEEVFAREWLANVDGDVIKGWQALGTIREEGQGTFWEQ